MGYLGKQITITGTQNSKRLSVLATDGQTTFTVSNGYTIGQLDVYRNGVKLSRSRDFTASDGTSVVLVSAANANDIVEFVVFENFDVANAITTGGDQTIGGALTVEGDFTAGTALTVTNGGVTAGILTAQSFHGDGSGLTGVGATDDVSTSSLVVAGISTLQNVTAGVATANQFSGSVSGVAGTFSGQVSATQGFSGNVSGTAATFTGNVTVGGVLTYDDVTNIDSLGLVTARNGLQVLAGITTLNGQVSAGNLNVTGVVTAASFSGDGSALTGVISGIDIESGGTFLGAGVTSVNFDSGATVTSSGAGATITIAAAGITTTVGFSTNTNQSLSLSAAQDHKYNVTGYVTFTCSGGSEGESHTLRVINSGIATVGFSTFFLFPSGASPVLPTTDGAISLISFTVNRVGTGGTQLLAGASVNFS